MKGLLEEVISGLEFEDKEDSTGLKPSSPCSGSDTLCWAAVDACLQQDMLMGTLPGVT